MPLKIDSENNREEFIKSLRDMIDIAVRASDATTYREVAFEIVLSQLIEHMFHDDDCDIDEMRKVRKKLY